MTEDIKKLVMMISTAVVSAFSVVLFRAVYTPPAELDFKYLQELAASVSNSKNLLKDKVAIVTGSTSGLGQEIATQLYKLGCTVIIASRNPKKCADTVDAIRQTVPSSAGTLVVIPLDISDLKNVTEFVARIYKEYPDGIDYLVNNAGMMYLTDMAQASPDSPLRSPQGYDKVFATNFMGHFLLTEELVPLLKRAKNARILNISSSVHLQVDGEALRPHVDKKGLEAFPDAARSDIFTTKHWLDSYGNSKLAQILHMYALQARLENEPSTNLKVVSVCPGFVNTSMVPDRPIARFISRFFFSCRAATLAPVAGLLDSSLRGGEWLTNFRMLWTANPLASAVFSLMAKLGLRDLFIGSIATPEVILFQNSSYGLHRSRTSAESREKSLSAAFYAWCQSEVDAFRVKGSR